LAIGVFLIGQKYKMVQQNSDLALAKRRLRLFLVLLGFALSVCARDALAQPEACSAAGIVTDATGQPLPGAVVAATSVSAEAAADADGRFCLSAPGSEGSPLTLIATLGGFRPQQLTLDARPGSRASIVFRLSPEFSAAVVVTGTRTGRRLDDVPVRTELIDRAAIDRVAARTLADAVEFTTGVRVEANCQNCNFSQIRLLGLEGPYTQILVDSQPALSSLAQVYGIEQLPARMIERIEVVKGGGSALYGPGSVGGVINVITREPASSGGVVETRGEMSAGVPNYMFNGAADWADARQQTFVTAYAQVDRVKPLDLSGDGFTEVARRNLEAAGMRIARYVLANRAKLTLDGSRIAEDRRGGNLLRLAPHEADIAESIQSERLAGSATWFHAVSRRFDYRGTVSVSQTGRDSYYGTGGDPNAYGRTDSSLTIVDAQLNHYVRKHAVSWGLQGSSEALDDRQPAYARFTDDTYRNIGLFVQDDWAFRPGWQVVYGVRADRHSAVGAIIASPRVALMISPRENLDVRVSMARGFRAPQVFDEDLHLSSLGGEARIIRLSPDLREERSANMMAGVEWKPEARLGQGLLEVNVFRTRLTDLFHVGEADDADTPEFEFVKSNVGGAAVYGVEVNVGWGIDDRLIFQGGIVEQRARFDEAEPDFGSRDFFRTPRRYGNLTATWKHPQAGDFFVGVRFTGAMAAPHYAGFVDADRLERTPPFSTIDASFSRPLVGADGRRLVLSLMGRNLTDRFQRDLDQGPLRDAAYVYGPRFPRSVSLGLRAEF
jgi:outer membrane receptor for ferrienterochelin and colicins